MARQFGATWWGRAWIDALENRAQLDPNRLPRGRTYARQDRVARLEVSPGRVTALVRGSRVLPYRVTVEVTQLDDEQWNRVAEAIAGRAAHAAALLDGALEPGVLADVRAAGVDLLPGPGEVRPRCSCPDVADPCKHAAAVCYLVADALDEDPFVLFALRGRERRPLLADVRRRRRAGDLDATGSSDGGGAPGADGELDTGGLDGGAGADPGVVARAAWQRATPPLPPRPHLPREPGVPAPWPTDPPPGAPFTAEGLAVLASDAARRAWSQLADGVPSRLLLDESIDLARLAADRLDDDQDLTDLARAQGENRLVLAQRAAAWQHAGADGVAALDGPLWKPPAEVVDAAIAAFADAGIDPASVQVRTNRITVGDVQLRVTPDGRWWRYERRGRAWDLVEPPADAPDDLVSGAADT